MPAIFLGHGSPMIALETNDTTRAWAALAASIPRPTAILCVSAHWVTDGVAVTAMANPKTIHDFGAFPQALFDVQYPAPGDPALAARVRNLLQPLDVALDAESWGLDHGAWSVLCKLYPDAEVPVVQLSLDGTKPPEWHYAVGQKLAALRDEGVLILGTGNIVHNLRLMDRDPKAAHDWAVRFDTAIKDAIRDDRPLDVIHYEKFGQDAALSVRDPDHYWPLLYVLGARGPNDRAIIGTDHIEHGSLSMTSVTLDDGALPRQ